MNDDVNEPAQNDERALRRARKIKCECGHPVYWCSGCNQYHHEPWGEVDDCVRQGGPFVKEVNADS